MYRLPYSAAILLAAFFSSHARHTVFISHNGEHSYLPSLSEPNICLRPPCVIEASDVLTSLDETVDPCDDFYRFACGGWINRQEVTEDEPVVLVPKQMQNNLNRKLRELVESKYENSDPPFVKMLKDFYNTCMDLDGIEKKGSEPLKSMLSRLGGWPVIEGSEWDESTFDWLDSLISFRKLGYDHNILMELYVSPKDVNDTTYIIKFSFPYRILQGNLSLGLSDDEIAAYYKTIVKAAKLLGADEAAAEKELLEVVKFMIDLKSSTISSEEALSEEEDYDAILFGDQIIRYHTVKELQEEIPQIPWLKYFNGILNNAVYQNDTVYVGRDDIDFLRKLANLLASTKKRVIANYMLMRAVLESSEFLSKEWKTILKEEEKLEKEEKPRWKTCMSPLVQGMGTALSSYYVRYYFKDENKDEAMILTKYIQKEFLKILEENDWMDEKTREKAEEKANALKRYIGYPEELLNDTYMAKIYENLTINTDSHLENFMAVRKVLIDKEFENFRKTEKFISANNKFGPVVRVNAFYNPWGNSINIPAGILHDAFYDKDRPNYMNFGAIGYVIGHEITHGFDDRGRQFDKNGNMVNWWDKKSDEQFRKKVQCIIDQYDNYTTDVGMKVNGELTQDENIADNGGLREAYFAYQSWKKDNGIEPLLPAVNYTQEQLFWLSAAHVWCAKIDPEYLKMQLLGDNHSPAKYRIIGPMSNLEEFSKDFKCSADSPMNRKYKCKVW